MKPHHLRILLIQTAFTGDVILATGLLETLHGKYPGAKLDFLVRKGNDALLRDHPYLHDLLVWDKSKNKFGELTRLLRHIRGRRYDLVVNCQRFFSSGLLTALSGAKERIGFAKNPLARFFDRRVPHDIASGTHETQRNHTLIEHLVPEEPSPPRLYPPPTELPEEPYFCLAPTSVWFTKQWPPDRWVALIRLLPLDHRIYLLGGPADQPACEAIREAVGDPRVQNLAGKRSLLESAALMAGARMNYVNDSAPTHLASAVNAPVTTIFCSTVPAFGFTPLSDTAHAVETTESLACRPCGLHGYRQCPEGHFRCAHIDPQRVVAASGLPPTSE